MRLFLAGAAVVLIILGLVYDEIDIHKVNNQCHQDHGIVVLGEWGQPGVGFSGYKCIEKGQHP